jgi:hypothetical protein
MLAWPERRTYIPQPYDWIPGVWCLMTYVHEGDTVSLMMYFERGRAKIFHTQEEADAYGKRL